MNKGHGISFQLALGQSRILPHSQTLHSPALPARPLLFLQRSCRSQSRRLIGRPAGGARTSPLYFWTEREGSISCWKTGTFSTWRNSCAVSWNLQWLLLLLLRPPTLLLLMFPEMPLDGTGNYGKAGIKTLFSSSNTKTNIQLYK